MGQSRLLVYWEIEITVLYLYAAILWNREVWVTVLGSPRSLTLFS